MIKIHKMLMAVAPIFAGIAIIISTESQAAENTSINLANNTNTAINQTTNQSEQQTTEDQYARRCPAVEDLVRNDLFWETKDKSWKCFSQSITKKIKNFIGAQWMGINVGKVICLYQPEEAMSFPIAMEQVHSDLILEPTGSSWSAPVSDRKLCKSVNIDDCIFHLQPPKDIKDIYKEIRYTGGQKNNGE